MLASHTDDATRATAPARGLACRAAARRHWVGLLLIFTVGGFWQIHEPHEFKVLFDEFGYAGIARNMHYAREASFPVRVHSVNGDLMVLDDVLDKRPFLFPFLVSAVHDLTGYRVENVFVVNALLGCTLLGLIYAAGCALGRREVGWLGVLLLGGLPLMAQNATGGGYEVLNLCLLLGAMLAAVAYLRRAGTRGMDLLVVTLLLLACVRYESVLFVLVLPLLFAWKWWKTGILRLTWLTALAPMFLGLPLLVHRVFLSHPDYAQTQPGQDFFSFGYLRDNLEHAVYYLFNPDLQASSSLLLSLLGAVAVVIYLVSALGRSWGGRGKAGAFDIVWLAFGGIVGLNTLLALLHFWGNWDDPVVSRFSLPLQVVALLALMRVTAWILKRRVLPAWVFVVLAVRLVAMAAPASAGAAATDALVPSRQFGWLRDELAKYDPERVLVVSRGFVGTASWGYPSVGFDRPNAFKWKFRRTIEERYYDEILVFQRFQADPESGQWRIQEDNVLPDGYRLETVGETKPRIDQIARLSRIVAVEGPGSEPPADYLERGRKLKSTYDYFIHQLEMLP